MENRHLRYAIVGCGMMGQEHLRNIDLLRRNGVVNAEIVALADPDPGMRDAAVTLARTLGHERVQPCNDAGQLPWGSVDAVVLASPNYTHYEQIRAMLPQAVPILAEKPLCTRADDLEQLALKLAMHPAPLWVAMEYRYMPATARFLERLREGVIGSLHMLTIREHRYPFLDKVGQWNRFNEYTGGTLVEKCCHHFDLMRLIIGTEPLRVFASGAMDVNHREESIDGRTPDVIDNALVIVEFAGGVRASLELCMFAEGADPQEQITAIGDAASLSVNIPGPDRFWPERGPVPADVVLRRRDRSPPDIEYIEVDPALAAAGDHHGSTYYQHCRFAAAVIDCAPVEVGIIEGAAAVRMGLAAQRSLETGAPVSLNPGYFAVQPLPETDVQARN